MPSPEEQEEQELRQRRRILWIILGALLLVLLMASGWFYYTYQIQATEEGTFVSLPPTGAPSSDEVAEPHEPSVESPNTNAPIPAPSPSSGAGPSQPTTQPAPAAGSGSANPGSGSTQPPPSNPASTTGTSSGSGPSPFPIVIVPSPVPPLPPLILVRETDKEAQTIIPNEGPATIFEFLINGNQPPYTLARANFYLVVDEAGISPDAQSSWYYDTTYVLERSDDVGQSWQEINRGTVGNRVAGNLLVSFTFPANYRVQSGTKLRLRASRMPCEFAGKTIDVVILDTRNQPTIHFTNAPEPEYTERRHPITIATCASARTKPIDPTVWLRFEEAFGTFADQANNGNEVTVHSAGILYAQTGKKSRAIHFGPGNDFLQFPLTSRRSLNFSDPVSIEMMIKLDKDGDWQGIVSKGNGLDQYDYHLAVTPNNTLGFYTDVGPAWYEGTKKLQKNTWYHIGMTLGACRTDAEGKRVGCILSFYVNGILDQVKLYSGVHAGPQAPGRDISLGKPGEKPIIIGSWSGDGHLFPLEGFIDELVFYDRVISIEEMAERYKGNL